MLIDRRRSRGHSQLATPSPKTSLSQRSYLATPSPKTTVKANKKAKGYLADIKKPNIYIAIYYLVIVDIFGLPVNINILISKDKHREFKKQIFGTNYRNPKKDLLLKENLRQVLRFLLVGTFASTDKLATILTKDIYIQCPALFLTLLPRSKVISLTKGNKENKLEGLEADTSYINLSTTKCIQASYIQRTIMLPTRITNNVGIQYPTFT